MELGITGHLTRGNEVIEILEMLGGKNCCRLNGDRHNYFYYISNKIIYNSYIGPDEINGYKILSLDDFLEKFPYKVGDKVWLHYENSNVRITETITRMRWCNKWNYVLYDVSTYDNLRESAFTPYKEETITIDDFKANTKEWLIDKLESMSKDNALQAICNLYDELHKPKYPKTYEECCDKLDFKGGFREIFLSENEYSLYTSFIKLIRCRDAYWKIAGEKLGLDKPWKPDVGKDKYIIRRAVNVVVKSYNISSILEFPTPEMRDAFYDNFKDLIEKCKELL